MESAEALKIIEQLGVPKNTVARIAGTHDAIVYNFLDGKSVSEENKRKVEQAIEELQLWIPTLSFAPSFKDWRAVQAALGKHRVTRLRAVGIPVVDDETETEPILEGR
jgi:hypothetical protein